MVFDRDLRVVQCGDALQRVAPEIRGRGRAAGPPSRMQEVFQLLHPMVGRKLSYDAIAGNLQNSFVLKVMVVARWAVRRGLGAGGAHAQPRPMACRT